MKPVKSPRHLWSGDWRAESQAAREERERLSEYASAEPETLVMTPPAQDAEARAPRSDLARGALGGLAVAIVLAGAFAVALATGVLHTSSSSSPHNATVKALPTLAAAPLKPQKGQSRAGAIYAKASPAVVSIRTSEGSGTGFLIDNSGTLVTNAHVVGDNRQVTVRFGANGTNLNGSVIGVDTSSDLAVVRVPTAGLPASAKPLALADSRLVRVGDPVVAIGNPFGLDRTETTGIVSGLGRSIQAPNGFQIDDALQTDAAINPGNSGGPLLNANAQVIGVNSQIETGGAGSDGNVGIGFAISSNSVRQVEPVLARGDKVAHPWLGVSTGDPANGSKGAQVGEVVPGGPAEAAGLQPGDTILSIDGHDIVSSEDVAVAINADQVGQTITVRVSRNGQEQTFQVHLGERPAKAPTP